MRYNHFSMLPEWAFQPRGGFRAGGMTLEGGSSGGGGSPQPTSTSQTTIPEYAQPYVERLLGKSEAASEAPYQTYGGERLVGATPEQQAARSGVAGLQQPGQFGTGTGLTTLGGLSAVGYGGQAAGAGQQYMGMATDPRAQQAFMSPYMQNVVDVQKQEAIRDAQKGQLAQNLAAARQGTYGGARQTLAMTERERNLGQNLAQIQATGSQKAFDAAQQAQQFGSQLGLQGLQAGISGSGQAAQAGATLGQLGIGQQQSDLSRLGAQEQFGSLAQRDQQAGLDLAYQDFLAQQRYPYSQLGFMSDILRGSGNLAGTGGTALYQAPPSTGSQLLGLASTLGGAYLAGGGKFMREGGEVSGLGAVKSYQDGGEVIQNLIDVNKLTAEQIDDTQKTGARPDVPDYMLVGKLDSQIKTLKMLQAQMAQAPQTTAVQDIRAEAEQLAGLDAIPVPDDYYMSEEQAMASGGIVAFADGGMSMDPGMPYGLGYGNNMGYAEGGRVGGIEYFDGSVGYALPGVVALGQAAARAAPYVSSGIGALRSGISNFGGADRAILGGIGAAGRGVGSLSKSAVKNPLTSGAVLGAGYGYVASEGGEGGEGGEETKKADTKKAPGPEVKVSDKSVKKVQQAEDKYEKYLTKLMDDAGMAEEDKSKALGLAFIKFGAKAMKARKGQEFDAYSEGVDAAANEYVSRINSAMKDKKEAMKTLAEYGLTKERIGVQREQVDATRAATSESVAMRREQAAEALQQKYFAAYKDAYKNVPEFLNDGKTVNPNFKTFPQFMKEAQIQTARGPETSVVAPGGRPPITSFRG
jgi:hypothetical protein